jgi:hypothetical protein
MKNPYTFGSESYYKYDLERFKKSINKLDCVPYLVAIGMFIPIIFAYFNHVK